MKELITLKPLLKRCSIFTSIASYWFLPHGLLFSVMPPRMRDRVEQLVHGNGAVGGDGAGYIRQTLERIRHEGVPEQRVQRTAGGIEVARRGAVLFPEVEARHVSVQVLRDVVGLVMRVAQFEQPSLDLVLQVRAVLPRVEAARIGIAPGDALSQIRQRPQRSAGGRLNAVAIRIVQRIVVGPVVVGGGVQAGAAAEAVRPRRDEGRLREAAEAAADHGVGSELVGEADARLDLVRSSCFGCRAARR